LGFGLSPLITAPLASKLINLIGVIPTFKVIGLVFLFLVPILGQFFNLPRKTKEEEQLGKERGQALNDLLKDKKFYGLWMCYVLGTLVGLMMIGITSTIGTEIINLPTGTSALLVSLFSIFNGIGRPFFGWFTDRYSPKLASLMSYSLIIFASVIMMFAKEGSVLVFVIAFSLFWLNLGGWLAIAPTATAIFFGDKNYSKNYGYIFTAYGVGAIIGTLISGEIRTIFGTYEFIFPVIIFVAAIGMIISIIFLRERGNH
jgi:MFS family permease